MVEEMELDQDVEPYSQLIQRRNDQCSIWTEDDELLESSVPHSMYTPSHASDEETSDRLGVTTYAVANFIYEAIEIKIFSGIARNSDIHVAIDSGTSCLADLFPSIWRPGFLKVWRDV